MEKFKAFIGNLWGRTTTFLLSAGVIVLADPNVQALAAQFPIVARGVQMLGLMMLVARLSAPPPPSVAIKKDDDVFVDHETGVIAITKADAAIPAGIISKPAGEAA